MRKVSQRSILLVSMLSVSALHAQELRGYSVGEHDGDTFYFRHSSGFERVRPIGYDSTELGELYSLEALAHLQSRVRPDGIPAELRIVPGETSRDRSGRLLAYVYVNGVFLNADMLRQGYGRRMRFKDNTLHDVELDVAETEAKKNGLNIWSGENPFRRKKR